MKCLLGIDAGSTTVKLAALKDGKLLASSYERHWTNVRAQLLKDLERLTQALPDAEFEVCLTGSAGMGIAERCGFKFVQELLAQVRAAELRKFKNSMLIDIGGEDAKIIFLKDGMQPDIRMNGSCAGGTGAFIDQMAGLMNVDLQTFAKLALEGKSIYPIASRCGVYAKTDVQNLISRRLKLEDICASIFKAVALQCASTLAKASDITPPAVCVGGPLSFMPALRLAFADIMKLSPEDMILPEDSNIFAAIGAASFAEGEKTFTVKALLEKISSAGNIEVSSSLEKLFDSEAHFSEWKKNLPIVKIPSREISEGEKLRAHIGVDSGSTTTKIAVIDENSELVFSSYAANSGAPLDRAAAGLAEFFKELERKGASVEIISAASTGYGEDLVRAAFGMEFGIVETMAHLQAAKFVSPKVSFVLDIGGQDIKSIFADGGKVSSVELNESCSSGCGSFLQGFANMMNMPLEDFAEAACKASAPCDLGTRCTVFMNSKVKESLRTQASSGDIAAGLAYSVVKNCLFKVLKISNTEKLGSEIVVQGGTFKNLAVRRAFEIVSQKRVLSTDKPELMGAYGAALYAKEHSNPEGASEFAMPSDISKIEKKSLNCKGCANSCEVSRFKFGNGKVCYAGNKCEKVYQSQSASRERGKDGVSMRLKKVFENSGDSKISPEIGIPRVLNTYENFPFWRKLFEECGFKLRLSEESTANLAQSGASWVMSENICFPAKLVHGHILSLCQSGVSRIFYPMVMLETREGCDSANCFNCPIVSGYPNVIKNTMKVESRFKIPFDFPVISFENENSLRDTCWQYFSKLNVEKKLFAKAFSEALKYRLALKQESAKEQKNILIEAIESGRIALVFAGRPYHIDPLINQKAAQIASDLGAVVVSDEAFLDDDKASLKNLNYVSQWTYPNRVMRVARAVSKLPQNIALVQINSFGCGPDSFISDEASTLLKSAGKNLTILRVDEISSPGSVRLRLRSLIESMRAQNTSEKVLANKADYAGADSSYLVEDRKKTILVPWFSDALSPLVPSFAEALGYKAINLPKPSEGSVEEGLKHGNNEVCYPATIVLGDIIKFLKDAKARGENLSEYVVAMTQTGGQCRATNYLALIKSAMTNAGFDNIKLLSLNFGETFGHSQPGFKVDKLKMLKVTFLSLFFSDAIEEMSSAMRARELVKGSSERLMQKFLKLAQKPIRDCDASSLKKLLKNAVDEFNAVEVKIENPKRIGFIGEIYLKYNSFAHCELGAWLGELGFEFVRPPLRSFVTQVFVNLKVNGENSLEPYGVLKRAAIKLSYKYLCSAMKEFDEISSRFKYARGHSDIHDMAKDAERIIHLVNQAGEGWLIAAEIAEFAKMGIDKVVCVQPFGCIANHVVAKGIERRVKELFPNMNLLFLDIDSGTAPVNLQNRLLFLIDESICA